MTNTPTEEEAKQNEILEANTQIKELKKEMNGYLIGNVISKQIMELPALAKLAYVQVTDKTMIEKRKIGSTEVPYLKVDYVERCLNFVSNFKRGVEVKDQGYMEYEQDIQETRWEDKPGGGKRKVYVTDEQNKPVMTKRWVYEAWVRADFWIEIGGFRIPKTCYGSWQSFENPATSKYTVFESARSIATKNFANTLGIGSDLKDKETEAFSKARQERRDAIVIDGSSEEDVKDATKDFTSGGQSNAG